MPRRTGPDAARMYYALIGDVTASRAITDRAGVQRRLRKVITALNAESGKALAVPLRLTAGDELQGLFTDASFAGRSVIRLADELHPVSLSWGLGRGPVTTDLDPDVSLVDGPCFHNARAALKFAVRERSWLSVRGFAEPWDDVLSSMFRLMWATRSRWTATQVRYVRAARGRLQQEAAEHLGVTKQSVSKTLDAAQFAHIQAGEESVRHVLAWLSAAAERPSPGAAR
jgi:hypothetical protein